jgi:hypothetical protein
MVVDLLVAVERDGLPPPLLERGTAVDHRRDQRSASC